MIVVVAPGQGSQSPGFLAPWLEDPAHRATLDRYSAAVGLDLAAHGTESDADTIRDTAVAQPLIVAASLLSASALLDGRRDRVGAVAGHSVGEFAAAALAGVLSEEEALRLVRERGLAMADAAALVPTGMSAVIGGDADALAARITELGLEAANVNGGGQTVVAGELANLDALAADPVPGTRVIPLQVAGAFHTSYMSDAVERVRTAADGVTVGDPSIRLYTNRDGSVVETGAAFLDLLIGQISSPVRWDSCMESMAVDGVTGIIELLPGGALTGLAKRGLRGVPSVAVKTPDDLPAAIEMLENA
ncbi:MAG: ACP S-malonyltransferase [Actinobacteria bacterium]|nr:ACP S-malonyltransferase [Actinomycetota bacterium]MBU1609500.1 ACP S-malonyltransferase [Actinomycetota bacterium]MBU2315335.1 ACP S-malonyltransferase [Actinomycetota bacterium]